MLLWEITKSDENLNKAILGRWIIVLNDLIRKTAQLSFYQCPDSINSFKIQENNISDSIAEENDVKPQIIFKEIGNDFFIAIFLYQIKQNIEQ